MVKSECIFCIESEGSLTPSGTRTQLFVEAFRAEKGVARENGEGG